MLKNKMKSGKLIHSLIASFILFGFVAGCNTASQSNQSAASVSPQSISIGMTRSEVASVVGQGVVNLCKKRTRNTSVGQTEVWTLYIFKLWPSPAHWSWASTNMGSSRVEVQFTDGRVSGVDY